MNSPCFLNIAINQSDAESILRNSRILTMIFTKFPRQKNALEPENALHALSLKMNCQQSPFSKIKPILIFRVGGICAEVVESLAERNHGCPLCQCSGLGGLLGHLS